jgi:nucleoside-diphosphate-sugar epimerase
MNRRVLITGASGFIAAHAIAPLRARGFEVHAIGRRVVPGVTHHRCDLFDRPAMRATVAAVAPSHVLHAAWYVEHGAFWNAAENLDWVAASLDLARACVAAGARRFVGIGSCAEYDWSDGGPGARVEDDTCRPATPYGLAKLAIFQLLDDHLGRVGVSFAWARLFHLYAMDEDKRRFVGQLVTALAADQPFVVQAPRLVRDYSAIEAIGAKLAALVHSEARGAVNVASGRGRSLADWAAEFGRRLGKPELIRRAEGGPSDRMVADVGKFRREVARATDT